MDHGLMSGMIVAGILLSSIPIALGVGIGVIALQRWRASRQAGADPAG